MKRLVIVMIMVLLSLNTATARNNDAFYELLQGMVASINERTPTSYNGELEALRFTLQENNLIITTRIIDPEYYNLSIKEQKLFAKNIKKDFILELCTDNFVRPVLKNNIDVITRFHDMDYQYLFEVKLTKKDCRL